MCRATAHSFNYSSFKNSRHSQVSPFRHFDILTDRSAISHPHANVQVKIVNFPLEEYVQVVIQQKENCRKNFTTYSGVYRTTSYPATKVSTAKLIYARKMEALLGDVGCPCLGKSICNETHQNHQHTPDYSKLPRNERTVGERQCHFTLV